MLSVAYLRTDVGECKQLQVPGLYSIGRANTSDFRPNTKSVSKRHAQLELLVSPTTGKPEAWIEDFNSTFGTYVGVSPVALEKIAERTRIFFGLFIRFGHAPNCYQYLEHPDTNVPNAESDAATNHVANGSIHADDRSVTDTVATANKHHKSRAERVPLNVNTTLTSPTHEEVATQLNRRPNSNEESPRSRIQDLVDRFEPSKSPVHSPDHKLPPRKGSSGNLSDNQLVMEMVTKIESSPSHNTREGGFNRTPSPEDSSKSHPEGSGKSPPNSFHSKCSDSYKDFAQQKSLKVDTTLDYQWIESLPGPAVPTPAARPEAAPVVVDTGANANGGGSNQAVVPAQAPAVVSAVPAPAPMPTIASAPAAVLTVGAQGAIVEPPSPSSVAPSKEADSGKELDYSIYDYDLDEKHGAVEVLPSTAFRRNPSLWEDPALFESVQESTSTRSMRTMPFNPMPSLQQRPSRETSPLNGNNGDSALLQDLSAKSQGSTLSERDRAIALLTQRNIQITQSRQVFRERKMGILNPASTQYPTFGAAAKQWSHAVASVDAVEGGFCISLVLPFMRKVKIEPCGRKQNKVRVEARRLLQRGDDVASDKDSEYVCEYKLQGLSSAIQQVDLSHEYSTSTGLLCIFVNRFKLQDPRLFVKERALRGAAYVPHQPARGSGMFKWLPGWVKGKKGRTERHNEQELQRALKESTSEASATRTAPKATPRGSKSGSEAKDKDKASSRSTAGPPKTPTSSRTAAAGMGVTSPRVGSAKLSNNTITGVTSPRASNNNKVADAPKIDRATLLQESIAKGEVDTNVEFI